MSTATAYFKVPTAMVATLADTVFPFNARDLVSVSDAWAKARELKAAHGATRIVRWGSVQIDGPWTHTLRCDR